MHRIGIVTAALEEDWASIELLKAVRELADGDLVDPMSFELRVDEYPSAGILGERRDACDAYIVRRLNARGETDYQFEVLELLEQQGKLIVNSPAGLSLAESKAQTAFCLQKAGLPVPRTFATQDLRGAADAVRALGTAVVKPLYGSHGIGVEKLGPRADNLLLASLLDRYGAICVQEFIPGGGRDIRAFVVGDEVPAAMYRIARKGEWKTNVAQGAACEACELAPALRDLCLEAARAIGLDYTGVDVIEGPDGPKIIELNGAPSWYGLQGTADRRLAADVVNHVLWMLDTGRSARQPTMPQTR